MRIEINRKILKLHRLMVKWDINYNSETVLILLSTRDLFQSTASALKKGIEI